MGWREHYISDFVFGLIAFYFACTGSVAEVYHMKTGCEKNERERERERERDVREGGRERVKGGREMGEKEGERG